MLNRRSLSWVAGFLAVSLLLVFPVDAQNKCDAVYGNGSQIVHLATGSPGELDLLEILANTFNKIHGTSICWKKAGSGASLKLLQNKEVDLVMVHAPAAEKIDFVVSAQGQKIINEFERSEYGDSLYNDAAYALKYDL